MDKPNRCKGCMIKDCGYLWYSKDCPCIKCLVKVTCLNYCKDHQLWIAKCVAENRRQLQETWI